MIFELDDDQWEILLADLDPHWEHNLVVMPYAGQEPSIECEDCGVTLVSFVREAT